MMKKSYVWALLASMFMVGCSQNDDLPENPGEDQKVEKEWSYMAINVNAAPNTGSRAGEDGFVAGDATESTVTNACFFFFDKNGDPFTVNGNNENNYVPGDEENIPSADAGGGNWVTYNYSTAGEGAGTGTANVEKQLPAVLTLSGINNTYPEKMVAVLNWTPTKATTDSYSLDELKSVLLESHLNVDKFIMSNSVYKSNGTPSENVYATQLTQRNFAKSPTDAKNNPVDIYVERVAAKVTVGLDETEVTTESAQFDGTSVTAIKVGATEGNGFLTLSDLNNLDVYAKIDGWDLNTTINKSYLLKSIEGNANYDLDVNDWNKPAYFRSYWATIPTDDILYNKVFNYDNINNKLDDPDYCLENTSQENTTKVIVKATIGELVDDGVNKVFKPLPLAYWMGTYYRVDDLKKVVANLLSDELYYKIGDGSWMNIDASVTEGLTTTMPGSNYIGMTTMTGEGNSYKVIFNYNSQGAPSNIKWSFDGTTELTGDVTGQLNAKLNALAPAQVWDNGQTYYVVPIKHAVDTDGKDLYGVIRNHVYQINITGVVGLGTPVFGNNIGNIEEPLVPIETDTYLAARINVLSWKVVNNNVELGK